MADAKGYVFPVFTGVSLFEQKELYMMAKQSENMFGSFGSAVQQRQQEQQQQDDGEVRRFPPQQAAFDPIRSHGLPLRRQIGVHALGEYLDTVACARTAGVHIPQHDEVYPPVLYGGEAGQRGVVLDERELLCLDGLRVIA